MNTLINKLPYELHIPSFHYCGPGTKLSKRLAANDPGINKLDQACKEHDIAYTQSNSVADRNIADKALAKRAWKRVTSSDATFRERAAALGVAGVMKVKSKLGMGMTMVKSKKQTKTKTPRKSKKYESKKPNAKEIFRTAVKTARDAIKTDRTQRLPDAAKLAVNMARSVVEGHKPIKKNIRSKLPRIIPVPKIGGILPLIPIFAGLSALGALMGGSAGVANAVMSAQRAKKELKEAQRHNQTMESIALGKPRKGMSGSGLHLKPYKNGLGLYLSPDPKNE